MANVPITLGGGASADLDQITAGAPQILAPYVGVNGDGDAITGTIPSLGAHTWTPSTSAQTIASGQYLSGTQTISAVSQTNLSAENIKKGTTITIKAGNGTIWSVTGTWEGYVVGSADIYNRGTWNVSRHTFFYGSDGTAALLPGVYHSTNYDTYQLDFAFGVKNCYGYTKLIIEGANFTGGTVNFRYKTSMPTELSDGTNAGTRDSYTTTKTIISLYPATINGGNLYFALRQLFTDGNGYVTRIYLQ